VTRVLVVAEHDGRRLDPATAKCVRCALDLKPSALVVAVLAHGGDAIAAQAAALAGVTEATLVDAPHNAAPLAAVLAPQVASLAGGYTHVLASSSTFGKDLLPRVAALLGVGQISDVHAVLGTHTFRRHIYAGNALVTVDADPARCTVATVRLASYSAVGARAPAPIVPRSLDVALPKHTRFVVLRSDKGARPDLATAARVVSGGRALGSAQGFELIAQLADTLGAAVGASRAAVDAGYAPHSMQVGQTGKTVSPKLYIACGVSGAVQHFAGMKTSKVIVAINSDKDAPIFGKSNYGILGDLFEVVPVLTDVLRRRRQPE
jgi:electron transfer flavoprotein alpha subunit